MPQPCGQGRTATRAVQIDRVQSIFSLYYWTPFESTLLACFPLPLTRMQAQRKENIPSLMCCMIPGVAVHIVLCFCAAGWPFTLNSGWMVAWSCAIRWPWMSQRGIKLNSKLPSAPFSNLLFTMILLSVGNGIRCPIIPSTDLGNWQLDIISVSMSFFLFGPLVILSM